MKLVCATLWHENYAWNSSTKREREKSQRYEDISLVDTATGKWTSQIVCSCLATEKLKSVHCANNESRRFHRFFSRARQKFKQKEITHNNMELSFGSNSISSLSEEEKRQKKKLEMKRGESVVRECMKAKLLFLFYVNTSFELHLRKFHGNRIDFDM